MYDAQLESLVPEAAELNAMLRQQPLLSATLARGPEGVYEVRRMMEERRTAAPGPEPTRVVDLGVPVRVFEAENPAALYVSIHGGGWMFGSAAADDADSARVAERCGITVLSIDYRMVPDVDWRTVIQDCIDVTERVLQEGQSEFGSDKVIIGGSSAGATLAVQTLLRLRDAGVPLDQFIGAHLNYGVYDFAMTPSQRSWNDTLIIDPGYFDATRPLIFPGTVEADRRTAEISPLYADLRGLPPALFSVGALDPFLDDSLFMAARWKAAGNDAQVEVYPESPHGFDGMPTGMARAYQERSEAFLRSLVVPVSAGA